MMFYSMPNSPFIGVLKQFTFQALAYGFYSKEWGVKALYSSKGNSDVKSPKSLEFAHLQTVFRYFALGMLFSALIFVTEIAWFFYKKYYLMKYDYVN